MASIRAIALLLPLAACIVQAPEGEQELRTRAPGSYSGTAPDGTALTMQLNADGTGTINGQPGTWDIHFGRLFLSDGKNSAPADLVGDQLTVTMPQGQVVFTRVSGAAAAGAAVAGQAAGAAAVPAGGPARPFAPEKVLQGQAVTLADLGMAFTAPDGFTSAPAGAGRYQLTRADGVSIAVQRETVRAELAGQPASAVLQDGVRTQLGSTPFETVVAVEDIDVAGQPAGRTILRVTEGGKTMEIYVAVVVMGRTLFLIGGAYPGDASQEMRPVVDTVIASFRGTVPAENAELKAKLSGCWETTMTSGGGTGTGSASTVIRLQADGTFEKRAFSSVDVAGASAQSDHNTQGRYRVEGTSLVTDGSQGDHVTYEVTFEGGILQLDGLKYFPCKG